MRTRPAPCEHHQRLFAAAASWFGVGGFLLLTTLVPARTVLLGWTPAFWLLVAPLLILLALERRLARQPLARRAPRRLDAIQATHGVIWH